METDTKTTMAKNSIWKMTETVLSKGTSTVISIILARILMPEDYGIVAISGIFISFSAILVQGGLSTTMVRKKTVGEEDYSAGFYCSFLVAGVLYCILFALAPTIAAYYSEPLLTSVLRIQFIDLFFYSLSVVQNAIVVREFRFKQLCAASFTANLIGGIVGVIMAYFGCGVWSLVTYTLVKDCLANFILLYYVRWKPKSKVRFLNVLKIFKESLWLGLGSIVDFVSNNVYNTVFGRRFSTEDLAYYSKGAQLPEVICLNTFGSLTSVLLPMLAKEQDNTAHLKNMFRKMLKISTYVVFPMMSGLAVTGARVVEFLFTSKWNACVPILWATCLYYGCNILRQLNMQVVVAVGKTQFSFVAEGLRCVLLVTSVSIGITSFHYDINMVAFNSAAVSVVVAIITFLIAGRCIDYCAGEWMKDLFPAVSLTVVMSIIVCLSGVVLQTLNNAVVLFLQILIGIMIYIGLSKIFRVEAYQEILGITKDWLAEKRRK